MSLTQGTTTPPSAAVADFSLADFASGAVGKSMGLSEKHLLVGLEVARQLRTRGALAEALRMHAMLALCAPTNIELQLGLAECAAEIGLNEIAMQAASVVIAMAPNDPRGYLLSGRSAIGMDAKAEAKEDLADAARLAAAAGRNDIVVEAKRLTASLM